MLTTSTPTVEHDFDTDTEPLLTPKDVARRLNTSRSTVYRLIEEDQIRVRRLRRSIRIPLSALREFIAVRDS